MHIFTLLRAMASRAMKTKTQFCASSSLFIFFLLLFAHFSEAKDLYQILGVDKSASQREIQKAFHRLSLKYHPDKNPSKNAEVKFAEINNAYEVLSDEEKRKNYDLFGDEQGRARSPDPHSYGGNFQRRNEDNRWSTFESSNNNNGYRFEQHSYTFGGDDSSTHGGDFFSFPTRNSYGGRDRSFSFGFGGSPFFQNMVDSLFGSMGGKQGERQHYSNNGDTGKTKSSSRSLTEELTLKTFQRKVLDELETWAILFVPLFSNDAKQKLQLLEQTADAMKGCIKVGYIDCEKQQRLCEEQNIVPLKTIKLRFYSLRNNGKLAALDYTGEWSSTALKRYCIDVLPRFSEHLDHVSLLEGTFHEDKGPIAVLLTKKKGTPAMWRALSGLFYGRIVFLDVQIIDDDVNFAIQKFHVSKFPAILGVSLNGETQVLISGKELEQISSSIEHLKALLEDFEKKSISAGPKKKKSSGDDEIPSLSQKNFRSVCGQDTTLCIIGIHRSSRGRDKLKQIFKEISQKTLIRKGQRVAFPKKPVFYAVVDATKQPTFLSSFESCVSESENTVLIAYKPKKGTYTFYDGPLNLESAENFVIEILVGDLQLKRVLQDPVLV